MHPQSAPPLINVRSFECAYARQLAAAFNEAL